MDVWTCQSGKPFMGYVWVFIFSFWIFSACETIVEVDLPEYDPVLVANVIFSPDSVWAARLYKSKGILEKGRIESVVNAIVEIKDGEEIVANLSHVSEGYYKTLFDIKPEIGRTYTLTAQAPDLNAIEATDIIPTPVQLTAVDGIVDQREWDITAHFTDPVGKNYYQVVVFEERILSNGSTALFPAYFGSDDLLFFNKGGIQNEEAIFDDALIGEKTYSLKLTARSFNSIRAMHVMLMSVTESYFKYMKSSQSQEKNGDNPFASPVQVYTNIEKGIGIFAGFSGSSMRVRL